MSILKIQNVKLTFMPGTPFQKVALDDMTLSINEGEKIGVYGRTGCGKSTLLQVMAGLIEPQSGHVFYEDEDIKVPAVLQKLRMDVGFVFQYPENQLFGDNVYEDVAFGLKNRGMNKDEIDKAVKKSLMSVGTDIELIGKRDPFTLSGGEKRRVAIAGILALKPKFLILDEPTAGLDLYGRKAILGKFSELAEREKLTFMIVSHDLEELLNICDRLVLIDKGKIVVDCNKHDIELHSKTIMELGIRLPFFAEVLERLKKDEPIRFADVSPRMIEALFSKRAGIH